MKVTVLGLGLMGSRMARRLLDASHEVTVWNRSPDKATALQAAGAAVSPTAAEAALGASIVLTMLADGPAVDDVLFCQGVAQVLAPGAIVLDMSSIPPSTAQAHAHRLAERGIDHLDAPVSGGTIGAEDGTLAILCGGDASVLERCRPLLEVLGHPTHVGPHGSGQLTKLCNQVIVASTIGAISEALMLAQAGGADPEAVCQALRGGFADSRILREHGQRMVERRWRPGGPSKLQLKDLDAATDVAKALGVDLPMLDLIRRAYESFITHGGGQLDHSALLLELERRNAPHRVGTRPDDAPEGSDFL